MCELEGNLSRRQFLAAAGVSGAVAASGGLTEAVAAPLNGGGQAARRRKRLPVLPVGGGGAPTDLPTLARRAREIGRGQPLVFVDLAAVDQNTTVILDFARANGFAVRPALKSFQSPGLCSYVLRSLPEPRGLLFRLDMVDSIMRVAPAGTDLMLGYPPTLGELERYLHSAPRRRRRRRKRRRGRVRILIDSVPLLEQLARLARTTRRRLPLDVALEFDSGMGRGGVDSPGELTAMIRILRAERERLRLGAVLCYDGHATLNGSRAYRKLVAKTAQGRFQGYLDQLRDQGGDLYNPRTLVRNGPASSNYRNWAGSTVANEISPGSAFVYAGYLGAFDHDGLAPAVTQASPLMRITGDHPSVPYLQSTPPGAKQEEVIIKAGPWPGSSMVYPGGMAEDELSGGGFALVAPKNALELGDYVLMRPEQSGDGIDIFGSIHAIREGNVLRRWKTFPRWSTKS
jgi:D-serine deaminase-like pyridoxal phosphate-dependent protein